jgi:hypothetical protein
MGLKALLIIVIAAAGSVPLLPQGAGDQELARLLASEGTRGSAVGTVLASRGEKIPLLLSWIQNPPRQVDKYELVVGLADIFGQLRTKQAIRFLI